MLDDKSFKKVLRSALNVSNLSTGQPATRAARAGSYFLLKNCLSGITFYRILYSTPIAEFPEVGSNFNVYDFPTAYAIIRTMFETYINMYYVLIEPVSEEEKEHRLDLWECHGLSEALIMGKIFGTEASKLIGTEREYLQLKNKIASSVFFKNLPDTEKQSIKDSDKWYREKDKVALAIRCGFHPSQAKFFYKFLSNYAHSERYSLMQIEEVKSPQEAQGLLDGLPKTFAEMLLALTLNAFAQLFRSAKELLATDQELSEVLNAWEKVKKKDFAELTNR